MSGIRTIVVDPPWPFRDRLPGGGRGAAKHYSLLSIADIAAFDLPPLDDDCRLFLWRVASMQEEALAVARTWGFIPKAEIVWVKSKNPPTLTIGMGRQVRMAHEVCLIAIKGRPERLSMAVPSVVFAPRGKHSAKPDEFYDMVERLSPGPYADIFARRQRDGWLCVGNEVDD